jgi:Bacteriocin-protection, YdeI or OmpD-Associated/Domain of unknown function (DUF1905)
VRAMVAGMEPESFITVLGGDDAGAVFIPVPEEVVERLGQGRRRPPVVVTFRGLSYPSTIAVYGGRSYLPVRKEIRQRAEVSGGDRVEVTLALDAAPRQVDLPDDLSAALQRDPAAAAEFAAGAHSKRRERVDWLTAAKRPETRARRLEKLVQVLHQEAAARG